MLVSNGRKKRHLHWRTAQRAAVPHQERILYALALSRWRVYFEFGQMVRDHASTDADSGELSVSRVRTWSECVLHSSLALQQHFSEVGTDDLCQTLPHADMRGTRTVGERGRRPAYADWASATWKLQGARQPTMYRCRRPVGELGGTLPMRTGARSLVPP